jgi:hypothetical protein
LTHSGLSDFDLYLFGEGKHERIYDELGAHAVGGDAGAPITCVLNTLIGPM